MALVFAWLKVFTFTLFIPRIIKSMQAGIYVHNGNLVLRLGPKIEQTDFKIGQTRLIPLTLSISHAERVEALSWQFLHFHLGTINTEYICT